MSQARWICQIKLVAWSTMHNLCHKCCTLHVHMVHVHADVHIWLVGILQCYNLLVLNSHQLVADWTRELHHENSLVRQNCLHSVKQLRAKWVFFTKIVHFVTKKTLAHCLQELLHLYKWQFHRGMLYKRGCVEVGHFSVQRIGVFLGKKLNNLLCWICLRDNFLHIGSTLDNMSTL